MNSVHNENPETTLESVENTQSVETIKTEEETCSKIINTLSPISEANKTEDTIVLFKCIVDFIHSLREMFGKQQHSLELYDLLMEKTGIVHQEPIKKHLQIFRNFVSENEIAILESCEEKMTQWRVDYSEKVYIDLKEIFQSSTIEDKNTIWQHLLTLLAVLVPTSNAKNVLKEQKNKQKQKKNSEGDFLKNMIQKVEQHVDPSMASDPTQMMSGILSSGLFTELMNDMNNGMSNGDLDLNQMMGSLQGMIGNMSHMLDGMNQNQQQD